MSSFAVVRWGAPGAILSGLAFTVLSLLSLATPEPAAYLDVIFGAAWLSTVLPVAGLHAVQEGRYGLLGRVGSASLVVGAVATFLGALAVAAESASLAWPLFIVGGLFLLAGLVVLGIASLRARVLPRWCGVALILALPLTALAGPLTGGLLQAQTQTNSGDYPGVIVMGLLWLGLGYALWSRRATTQHLMPAR